MKKRSSLSYTKCVTKWLPIFNSHFFSLKREKEREKFLNLAYNQNIGLRNQKNREQSKNFNLSEIVIP